MPFGADCEFVDFDACVAANGEKDDPDAYCAELMRRTEEHCEGRQLAETEERSALPVHHTATSDDSWDGSANKARLRNDGTKTYYRSAYAWVDPNEDGTKKAHYKFIHHNVAEGGDVGSANLRACSAGIAVLNGGRAGTTIPDSDRRGVYRHLAAHLRDADKEPSELRANADYEKRSIPAEFRIESNVDGERRISWYAALFDIVSEDLGGFREKIGRRAFTKSLQENDIRALINHDPNMILARSSAGTLNLHVDLRGLFAEAILPETSYANDLVANIENGNIRGGSFAFQAYQEKWAMETSAADEDVLVRTLNEVRLYDVSTVAFPAYLETEGSVALRSLAEQWKEKLSNPEADWAKRQAQVNLNRNRRQLDLIRLRRKI